VPLLQSRALDQFGRLHNMHSMNLSQRTMKAGSWQLAAVVVRVVIQLLVLGILARHVQPKEFGLIAMANMVMVFVDMFADAGIGPAIIQKKELSENHIRAGFHLSVALGIIFVAILWLSVPFIADLFKSESLVGIVRWIGLTALIAKIGIVSRSRIEREMRFDILMWVDTGSYLFGYALVGIILAVNGFGAWAIVVGKLTQCGLQTMCLVALRPNSVRPISFTHEHKELLTYGGGLTISRIFDNIASQGDYFMIGRFLGSTALGVYDRASSLSSMPGQYLNVVLDKVLFPAMSQVQDQPERLKAAYLMAVDTLCALLMPLTVLMFIIAPEIVGLLLGPNWSAAIAPFRILLVVLVCRILINISDTLVRATGAVYPSAIRKAILAVLIIASSWVGQRWGISAVAIAVDASLIIGYILMLQLSLTFVGCGLMDYLKYFKHGLFISGILCLTVLPVVLIMRSNTSSDVLVLCGAVVLSVLLLAFIVVFCQRLLGGSVQRLLHHILLMLRWKKSDPVIIKAGEVG
jgi:O-antigen/teichoic acid export membrane protein